MTYRWRGGRYGVGRMRRSAGAGVSEARHGRSCGLQSTARGEKFEMNLNCHSASHAETVTPKEAIRQASVLNLALNRTQGSRLVRTWRQRSISLSTCPTTHSTNGAVLFADMNEIR